MQLSTNVGPLDRVVRVIIGLSLVGIALTGIVIGPWAWVTAGLAAVLLATGAIGFCPLYAILGLSTCPVRR